jgi:hypothetical protein
LRLDAVALDLLLERIEIVVLAELERDARAARLRAFAQHDRVVIDGVGEKDRVLLLGGDRHAEDVAVIVGLLLDVGHVVAGVSDFFDSDHMVSPFLSQPLPLWGLSPSPLWGGVGVGVARSCECVDACALPPDPHPTLPTRGRVNVSHAAAQR